MIRKPKQMSESMILAWCSPGGRLSGRLFLQLPGAGFRQRADWKHCPAGPKYRQRQLSKRPPLPVPPAGFFSGVYLSEWSGSCVKAFKSSTGGRSCWLLRSLCLLSPDCFPKALMWCPMYSCPSPAPCRWTAFGSSGASHAPPPCALAICAAALSFYADTISPRTRS